MKCPYCSYLEDKVLNSRTAQGGEAIRRRRECMSCGRRFTTYEQIEEMRVMVVKRDGRRESFDREKILKGLLIACRKRPISVNDMESMADDIERKVYDSGEKEIAAEVVGEMVADALKKIDPVAYVRFASVYRQFEDVGQFKDIIDVLGKRQNKD